MGFVYNQKAVSPRAGSDDFVSQCAVVEKVESIRCITSVSEGEERTSETW